MCLGFDPTVPYSCFMRRTVEQLQAFYDDPAGQAARSLLAGKVVEAWGDGRGLDVLGLGFAGPFVEPFLPRARRVCLAMPAAQGVSAWPHPVRNQACLVGETALPFPAGFFDRIVLAHALEEAANPAALLAEAGRVLSASGRIIVMVAARGGLWAGAEATPFGHGQPFTRGQLEALLRDAELEPTAWSYGLYVPPWRPLLGFADSFEQLGAWIWPGAAGVILMEAERRTFAVRPQRSLAENLAVITDALKPPANPVPVRRGLKAHWSRNGKPG